MLVGRRRERLRIEALLSSARLGQSGVLVLTGEPGIGKTALLAYAASCAGTMQVLTVTGTEAEHDLPFAGLAQLLRLRGEDLARLPDPQARALGIALALRPGVGADRFAVGAGLATLLTQASEDRPTCLLVDDAHLLDEPSQQALAFAARRLLADAIAVVVAARSGEPCRLVAPDLPQLQLTGIDVEATQELVEGAGVRRPGPEMAQRIHALTGGNPLAVAELASGRDDLLALPPDAPTPVPLALARLYARRADSLAPPERQAALVAATVGEDLRTIAATCTALDVPVETLQAAEELGLLTVSEDRVRFRHPLIRSGLYAATTPAERRRLHAAVASVLPDAAGDRRAWHRAAAAVGPDEPTAADLAAVARAAADRGAFAVAAAAGDRAAALTPESEPRSARWLAAGTWAWQAGDAVRARALLDHAVAEAAPPVVAQANRLRGVIAARCGAVDEARDLLLDTGDATGDQALAVACYAEAVDCCFCLGDATSALLAADRIERVLPTADVPTVLLGQMARGKALILAGRPGGPLIEEALAGWTRHGAAADQLASEPAWWNGALFARDVGAGRRLIGRAVDERRAQSAVGALPHLLFHIARDEATTDRWSRGEADYTEAITLAREFGQTTELTAALAGLAWLEARLGRPEATNHATEAIELADRFHIHTMGVWAHLALADLAAGRGDPEDAAVRYEAVEVRLAELGILDVDLSPGPELVEVLLRTGRRGQAAEVAERYAARAAAKGQPWALARAARLGVLLGDDAELDAALATALDHHAGTVDRYEEARTLLAYGARVRRARRRVDARPALQQALDTFDHLGARPWALTAADELAATGLQVTRPGQSPLSRLTPRELQIALLLAEGRTTRQAATALFLSPKTVEYHLRHVYLKFGIESRAQLAALLTDRTPAP